MQVVGPVERSAPWRWREAGLAALVWFVPMTGLFGQPAMPWLDRALGALLIGTLVGAIMSVPLGNIQLAVLKTATARRVLEAVFTTIAAAAALRLLELDDRSLVSVAAVAVVLWLVLSVSVAARPLAVRPGAETHEPVSWLPVAVSSPVASGGKRLFDIVAALVLIAVSAPIQLIVAVAIRLHDGGPIVFRQTRVGRGGRPFEILKFRSMVVDAEARRAELESQSERSGPLFKMTHDPRITPIGRIIRELSIDELPQLFNILRGDMSLVGPRPALPSEAEQFDAALLRRTQVMPGLTGLWQAEARNDADFERFRELDLRYVSTASPTLDLWIIFATAAEVVVAIAKRPLELLGVEVGVVDGIEPSPAVARTRNNAA